MPTVAHNPHSLVVLSEKHAEWRFAAPTLEELHRICVMIVKEREASGNWYFYESEESEKPEISKEALAKMKDGAMKEAGLQEWRIYEASIGRATYQQRERTILAKTLAGDGQAALQFLNMRRNGEYEGFEITTLDTEYSG